MVNWSYFLDIARNGMIYTLYMITEVIKATWKPLLVALVVVIGYQLLKHYTYKLQSKK